MKVSIRELRELFDYDPKTGILKWRIQKSPRALAGDTAGTLNRYGYLQVGIDGKVYRVSRIVWAYVYGEWPTYIDHINGNRVDNRINNLRNVDMVANNRNRARSKNNTSGATGVFFNKRKSKWEAFIRVNSTLKYLGRYEDFAEAVAARKAADKKYGFHENHGRYI